MRRIGLLVALVALATTMSLHFTAFAEVRDDPESSEWSRLGFWEFESPSPDVPGGEWGDVAGGEKTERAAQLLVASSVAFAGWALVELLAGTRQGAGIITMRAFFGGVGSATLATSMSGAWAGFQRAITQWPGQFELRLAQPVAGFEIVAALVVGGYGIWRFGMLLRAWYMLTED